MRHLTAVTVLYDNEELGSCHQVATEIIHLCRDHGTLSSTGCYGAICMYRSASTRSWMHLQPAKTLVANGHILNRPSQCGHPMVEVCGDKEA